MNRLLFKCFALGAACAVTSASTADTVDLSFDGLTGGGVAMKVHFEDGGGTDRTLWTAAGRFEWNGNSINSFCVELTQYAGDGTFDCVSLGEAPSPALSDPQIDAIAKLYEQHGNQALDFAPGVTDADLTEAAAFQMVIWEIISETDTGAGTEVAWNINGGNTTFSWFTDGGNGDLVADAKLMAQGWLTDLMTSSLQDSAWLTRLQVLTNANKQDQIILVPLPAPLALASLGVLGVVVARRRLT